MVRLQSRTVVYHNIVGGCDSSLTDMLRNQEEIKPEKLLHMYSGVQTIVGN